MSTLVAGASQNASGINATGAGGVRSQQRSRSLRIDPVLLALVSAILLLGLIMVTSASITTAAHETGDPFFYLERQLVLVAAGLLLAALVFAVPIAVVERLALPLLG
ncbi:MAG: hypothetical protein RL684_2283, partial [Pseudomonadota bacterium]